MTHKQAKKAMPYAPRNVEVLERLEIECCKCEGRGIYAVVRCPACNGTKKIGWKWQPKFGQMVIYENKVALITGVNPLKQDGQYDILLQISPLGIIPEVRVKVDDVTPILHWEDDIEPILKEAGYELIIKGMYNRIKCHIFEAKKLFSAPLIIIEQQNITRQEAVSLTVDALGKELENTSNKV